MAVDKVSRFFLNFPEIKYKRGENILRPNEYFGHTYLIKEGYIRVYKLFKSGQEITISFSNPKKQKYTILGYTDSLTQYYVEAFTDVILRRSPKIDFQQFCEKNPQVKDSLLHDLQIYFEEVLKQVEWLSIPDAYTRIKAILYSLAERIGYQENRKVVIDNKWKLELKVTHHLIASFAGLSRETVTIQMNRLIAEGYISRHENTLVIQKVENLIEDIM